MTESNDDTATPPPGPSSRSLVRYDGPRSTAELAAYAQLLAGTSLANGKYRANDALPAIFRGNPAAIAFASEYAKAIDVSPITAVMGLHMIDGKPSASAGLISALVRRGGHRIRTWTEGSVTDGTFKAVTTIERFDDPGFIYRSEWDLPRAVRANLMKHEAGRFVAMKPKSGWDNYPENMCKARTITECARDAAEDALLGVHYTPEELGVEVDEAGEPVYSVTAVQENRTPPAEPTKPDPAERPDYATAAPSDLADMADEVREAIIACHTVEDLTAVWLGPIIAGQTERALALETANAQGEAISLKDVFALAGEALSHGKRDAFLHATFGIETVDGEIVDEEGGDEAGTPAQDPPNEPDAPTSGTAAPEAAATPEGAQNAATAEPHPENHGPGRRALNLVFEGANAEQRAAIVKYAGAWQLDPTRDDRAANEILDALANEIVVEVKRIGGPSIPFLVVEARNAIHEHDLAESVEDNREEAAAAVVPGNPRDRKAAAAHAARQAAKDAKAAGHPEATPSTDKEGDNA